MRHSESGHRAYCGIDFQASIARSLALFFVRLLWESFGVVKPAVRPAKPGVWDKLAGLMREHNEKGCDSDASGKVPLADSTPCRQERPLEKAIKLYENADDRKKGEERFKLYNEKKPYRATE
jgi:hypothetical protein